MLCSFTTISMFNVLVYLDDKIYKARKTIHPLIVANSALHVLQSLAYLWRICLGQMHPVVSIKWESVVVLSDNSAIKSRQCVTYN